MVLMISYDLNRYEKQQAYEAVKSFIEKNSISWARPLKSQWFVETLNTPDWWNTQIMKFIDTNDRLFVCRITPNSYQGYLDQEIWDWLNPRVR